MQQKPELDIWLTLTDLEDMASMPNGQTKIELPYFRKTSRFMPLLFLSLVL